MAEPRTTAWLIEEVFIESMLNVCRTENIRHFHDDGTSDWPLVSVKAVLAQEDPSEIKHEGEPCEVHNVFIVAEWPITAEVAGLKVSATELDKLAREITEAVRLSGDTQAITMFSFFDIDPLAEEEKDVEEDQAETPTRRVSIASFEVIVIRG